MDEKKYHIILYAVAMIGAIIGTFVPLMFIKVLAVVVTMASLVLLINKLLVGNPMLKDLARRNAKLEEKLKHYDTFRAAAQRCVVLENRLASLEAIPEVDETQSLGLQLSRLNNTLVNSIPNFESKGYESLMDNLSQAVRAEELLNAFRHEYTRPFMDRLKRSEIPLSPEMEADLIAMMMSVAMSAVDVAETSRENINARPEQHLTKHILLGTKTREQAYTAAKSITDNLFETPVWARTIKSIALRLGVAEKPILYSGYKIDL